MRLGRKERLEQPGMDFRRHAAAGIPHANHEEPLDHVRFNLHNAATFDGFGSIAYEVFNDLPQQAPINPNFRRGRHELRFDSDVWWSFEAPDEIVDDIVRLPPFQLRLRKSGKLQIFAD